MKKVIEINSISKEFKVLNRREGMRGTFMDLFSRNYRKVVAVENISMDVYQGEIVGYLGPNGAGKSTTIKMMTGILEPTSGEILVNGVSPYKNRSKNAQNMGVVFGQRTQLWWALPVIESFKILKDIYQVEDEDYNNTIKLYNELVDFDEISHKLVRQLSLGQRTLCDILAAFLHNPKIVFLDEPTIGLDVSMKDKIRSLIRALNEKKGTTVILTTHDMGDVDALCDRIVVIDKGKIIYNDNIEKVKKLFGTNRTLKIMIDKSGQHKENQTVEEIAETLEKALGQHYPENDFKIDIGRDNWIEILVNEEQVTIMNLLNFIQSVMQIYNIKIEDISTEQIIKKIYAGELEERK